MSHDLAITPIGHLMLVEQTTTTEELAAPPKQLLAAFEEDTAHGLLHLAAHDLPARLPPAFGYVRSFARGYLTKLCQTQAHETANELPALPPPPEAELASWVLQAPPMTGLEYLRVDALNGWWTELDALVREEIRKHKGGAQAYLSDKNPSWRFVGRVTLHLAENKRDPHNPFAFLATYASRLSDQGRIQHEPLERTVQQHAGAKNRQALLALLVPIQRAAERSVLIKRLVESGDIYHPLVWSPREAHQFLQDIPIFEESGLIVRVPDWWKPKSPPRAAVSVKIDGRKASGVGVDSMLDFSVDVSLDGEPLSESEREELLSSVGGLVRLKGKWVEVDREKLAEALKHWQKVERDVGRKGLSFFEGMRMLAGATIERDAADALPDSTREWTGLSAGPALNELLKQMTAPDIAEPTPPGLLAELRPYQRSGVRWLGFLTRLGLGACLADDMGLGKTVQVIGLLLNVKRDHQPRKGPSLLVVPASLIANWKAEIERFAPTLTYAVAHPSETSGGKKEVMPAEANGFDLIITTYGVLTRQAWLREHEWNLVILDEAQAIKNSGTRQSHAVKELRTAGRVAMTGTPVENRLSDLWSLFDFLNPGLLGAAKTFASFVKKLNARPEHSFQPLRALVQPYILRRLKTDKRVIADLPDKTEVKAFCGLTRRQAALYEESVRDLERKLMEVEGIQRLGLVLAQLMRLKQICNHPDQMLGHGTYDPTHSSKFQRLGELCEELAQRQEKALIFTQFREIVDPVSQFLAGVFGRPGLVLHGGTAVGKRRALVEQFQKEGGPPFFVLSLKAGGTGLNLTAASQVIHFDRWWNPAVENQATDRAFRIGQKKNVLVHKFVCRGTVEERIDAMITEKSGLAHDVVEGGERMLTEMKNDELLNFVALDIHKALEA